MLKILTNKSKKLKKRKLREYISRLKLCQSRKENRFSRDLETMKRIYVWKKKFKGTKTIKEIITIIIMASMTIIGREIYYLKVKFKLQVCHLNTNSCLMTSCKEDILLWEASRVIHLRCSTPRQWVSLNLEICPKCSNNKQQLCRVTISHHKWYLICHSTLTWIYLHIQTLI